jgi:two-component system, OmpR family, response regulator
VRVLIVEDQPKLARVLRDGLAKHGLVCDLAATGEDALWMAASTSYDVLTLDVMLPGIDGFATCRRLREQGIGTPVLMLTARNAVSDRVAGLDGGADDYLAKPFSFAELLARVRALARRPSTQRAPVVEVGDLRLDLAARRVWRSEQEIALTAKELLLLEALALRAGEVLSRIDLLESAWDHAYENRSNVVDAYIRRLRKKIDEPFGIRTLMTVRGSGYRLTGTAG